MLQGKPLSKLAEVGPHEEFTPGFIMTNVTPDRPEESNRKL